MSSNFYITFADHGINFEEEAFIFTVGSASVSVCLAMFHSP
jgi:hypothetical protein